MTYEAIARRLGVFVGQVVGDVRFRRRLRYHPQQALADHGLPAADAPLELPVRHWTIEVSIDLRHLCGGLLAPKATRPPLAARLVALGARPLALIHGAEAELVGLRQWGEEHGLVGLLTPWQLALRTDAGKGGFSNLAAEEPAVAGSGAHRGLLLAADASQAMLGWLSLLCRWDAFLGRLLGYPACCADAFATRWNEARELHQGDVAGLVAKTGGAGPFPWPLNPFLRYGGSELVPHFPCRFDCPASLDLARRLLATLELAEPAHAAALRRELPTLVLYTETNGVFACRDAEVRAIPTAGGRLELAVAPQGVSATEIDSPLARAWRGGATLSVGGGEVVAGDVVTGGWLVDFRGDAPGFSATGGAAESLGAWLAGGSGVVEPGAGARLLDFARTVTAERVRGAVADLATRVAGLPEPPRDAGRFAAGVAAHLASRPLHSFPSQVPLGRIALALGAAATADWLPGRALAGVGALAGTLAGRLDRGAGLVVPREAFGGPGETLDLAGAHCVIAAAGGPVALRGADDLCPGPATVVTWLDGAAVRFDTPPAEGYRVGGRPRLQAGARLDEWPVLAAGAGEAWRVAVALEPAVAPGRGTALALAGTTQGETTSGETRPDGSAATLAPPVAAEELAALRDGIDFVGSLCPGWLQAAQRGIEALGVVPEGSSATPLPDVLAVPAAALAAAADAAVCCADLAAAPDGGALPQPLAAAVALAAGEGRRRVVMAWPLLEATTSDLATAWRAGSSSALAATVATLDVWRLAVATAERLAERGGADAMPPPLRALLAAALDRPLPDAAALAAELRPEVVAALAAEVSAVAAGLRKRTLGLVDRADRTRASGGPQAEDPAEEPDVAATATAATAATAVMSAGAATLALPSTVIDEGRARFARDGVCELPAPVLSAEAFDALGVESVEQARHAWASDRATPPQSCWRAEMGPFAQHVSACLQPVVEAITGSRLALSREASCYTYYVGPGSFGGRHQDRVGACTVTCLVYLHAEASAGPPSAGLTLRVWRAGEPASAEPFAIVPTASNLGLVLLGSRLPHERPQLAAGETVSLLALCFGAAGETA
jgi:hypothetical protein